ncbi:3795_t:CDS:2 [Diversispora eburnea]|uniref:3795_t:CDS:1 n=1 Tax=Diversispora eburnea TaxID=1213867 RepID=A0A9N8VPD6_9GLOM|nr:3795_t:CDS:2 [Diversispora eburnea]
MEMQEPKNNNYAHEDIITIEGLNNHLGNINQSICEADNKIIHSSKSFKKLRENCVTRIESIRQELIKWINEINKKNVINDEEKKNIENIKGKLIELQNIIEQKFSSSTVEILGNLESIPITIKTPEISELNFENLSL